MLKLKALLRYHNLTQADLGRALKLSDPTIAQLLNHSQWPKTIDPDVLRGKITTWLESLDISPMQMIGAFNEANDAERTTRLLGRSGHCKNDKAKKDDAMLLRKQTLTQQAKQAFGLLRDPFSPPRTSADLFISPDIRFVRENLYQVTRYGTFMAIIGESGSGKSTIRKELHSRLQAEDKPVIIIEPYIQGMDEDTHKGRPLKSNDIAYAILDAVAPGINIPLHHEHRFRAMHNALRESHRGGSKHVLIIEEAHALPIATLKHLKRFYELEDGFDNLLSIVLIGQPELGIKLSENRADVREVVQRCEVIRLHPLGDQLGAYLAHRFKLIGKNLAELMDEEAIEALRDKLTISSSNARATNTVLYPLAVHNVLTAALNLAAAVGAPRLTPDILAEV
jgi:type II secretory pathway predicted ATPase ExeA